MIASKAALRLAACVVGLVAASLLAAACSRVPLTGRKQMLLVSEAEEIQLGAASYGEVLASSNLSKDAGETARIRTIGTRIAAATGKTGYQWEFCLIDADSVVNAFCLPGGKVAIYSGIRTLASTDDELATVMAHEIAHAVARHGGERMSQLLLVQLGGIALSEALKNKTQRTIELATLAYGAGTTLAYVLPYSRVQETEADYMGLIFQAKAGYDPRAALAFWRKMLEKHGGEEGVAFLSTHPNSAQRIADIDKRMPEALAYYEAARK
jgi:predicted Zn-dependent protease